METRFLPHTQEKINFGLDHQRRTKVSSAAFIDFAFNHESVKESVKKSFLDRASRKDSKLWRADRDMPNPYASMNLNGDHSGVNDPISAQIDSLEDWNLDESTKYWPDLPPNLTFQSADPFALSKIELDDLSRSIREDLLGTDHPVLNKAASYLPTHVKAGKENVYKTGHRQPSFRLRLIGSDVIYQTLNDD